MVSNKNVCLQLGFKGGNEFGLTVFWEQKKPTKKKHLNNIFTGLSRNSLGILFMCFLSPMRNDPPKHINKILLPTESCDNPPDLFMFVCFLFP